MRVLVVEDDNLISTSLVKILTDQHYTVDSATDGQAGWELVDCFNYDLILLDVMLPKLDGISFCRKLRSQGNKTPIFLLTAQDTSTNKVMGLDAGADDYLAKPFDFQELLARIRALLRRGGSTLPPLLEWGNLQLDPSSCEVTCDGQILHLTPKEYSLLELFLRNPHRVFSCGALIDHLWSFEEPPTDETVRSHIKGLRQKLKAAGVKNEPIETVYGIGYKLKAVEKGGGGEGGTTWATGLGTRRQGEGGKNSKFKSSYKPPLGILEGVEKKSQIQNPKSQIQNQIVAGVSKVWDEVAETLNQRVAVIEQASAKLRQDGLSAELRLQAKQEAHKLLGSLGMFGSDEGSLIAGEIESLLAIEEKLQPAQKQHLQQLVVALRQELQGMNAGNLPQLLSEDTLADESPLLWVVDRDREFTEALVALATGWQMQVQIVSDAIAAKKLIVESRPDVVLLDLSFAETAENALLLLTELTSRTPPVPVIVFTAQDSLIDRVRIARLGGRGVLQKPVPPAQVLETVAQMLPNSSINAEAKVMVVDDDPQVLTALQRLLAPWNIKVFTLDNPLRFLDVLQVASPDLLILDVEMPNVSGIELCQVIRNDPHCSGLPILFLTAHKDAKTRHQVFAAGADDYVSKPILEAELVTRILNRLERTRLLRSLAETDALTGVANRRKFAQEMTRLIQCSERYNQPLCLAIVQLNQLKQINQKYGHAVGDRILSRLGELLRRTFHGEDVVGRWGGTEFVVGMARMGKIDGVRRLSEVLKNLRQLEFTATNNRQFSVSFTTGIVQYPEDGSDIEALYQAANLVLEQAKTAD